MVKIEFLGPINRPNMEIEVSSLTDLSNILKEDSGLKEWLASSAVAVNDTIVTDPNMALKDGDKVSILPPVCGG